MENELKPCPACGGNDLIKRYYSTKCCACGASTPNDRWNTRPIEDALTSQLHAALEANERLTNPVGQPVSRVEYDRVVAQLARYTEPLTDSEADRICESTCNQLDPEQVQSIDAAIRAVREGER